MNTPLTKADVIQPYLPKTITARETATAFAPSNIALCKYWGKRNAELNLPINGSLSISLGELGTTTTLNLAETDSVTLNGKPLDSADSFYQKIFTFINLFRPCANIPIAVNTVNTIPTSAGLASSASGFSALTLAINDFFNLDLPLSVLSAFARMGSGSASRSLYSGFVQWHKGEQADGMDSFAEPIDIIWPEFRIGLVKISTEKKKIDSREGMNRTVKTSNLYKQWPAQAEQDLITLRQAVMAKDFVTLGQTAEHNALSMHATMIATWPAVLYWQPESVATMHAVWALREQGIPVYLTMDAGPNLKLLFTQEHTPSITKTFPDIDIITPFS